MPANSVTVRDAVEEELDQLATIWFNGWHESHARIVPAELTRVRTFENFRARLQKHLPRIRVAGPIGSPTGFAIVKRDELYQLFVLPAVRGTGAASALLADAEIQLSQAGVATAWLACAIGNDRAARFYEKCGWRRAGTMINQVETSNGLFALEVWRYEKGLRSLV